MVALKDTSFATARGSERDQDKNVGLDSYGMNVDYFRPFSFLGTRHGSLGMRCVLVMLVDV